MSVTTTMRAGLLLLCLWMAGCESKPIRYIIDRSKDFVDPFKLTLSLGYGLDVEMHATRYVAPGLGYAKVDTVGMEGRYAGQWEEERMGYSLIIPIMYFVMRDTTRYNIHGNVLCYQSDPRTGYPLALDQHNRKLEVGGKGFLGFIGVEAGADVMELADFLTGWFGLDLTTDDIYRNEELLNLYSTPEERAQLKKATMPPHWSDTKLNSYLEKPEYAMVDLKKNSEETIRYLFAYHDDPRIYLPAYYELVSLDTDHHLHKYWLRMLEARKLIRFALEDKRQRSSLPLGHLYSFYQKQEEYGKDNKDNDIFKSRCIIAHLMEEALDPKNPKGFETLLTEKDSEGDLTLGESGRAALVDFLAIGGILKHFQPTQKNNDEDTFSDGNSAAEKKSQLITSQKQDKKTAAKNDTEGRLLFLFQNIDTDSDEYVLRTLFLNYLLRPNFFPSEKDIAAIKRELSNIKKISKFDSLYYWDRLQFRHEGVLKVFPQEAEAAENESIFKKGTKTSESENAPQPKKRKPQNFSVDP